MPRMVADERPLTLATVTWPTRLMLPVYIFAGTYIGLCYIFSPDLRLQGASLVAARRIMPMDMWGVIALSLAFMIILAAATQHRQLAVLGLCVAAIAYLAWSVIYAVAIWQDPTASLVPPIWPFVAAAAHFATGLSLTRREAPHRGTTDHPV